jgi:DNA invertase Pin-like site-specific DNA recombinase
MPGSHPPFGESGQPSATLAPAGPARAAIFLWQRNDPAASARAQATLEAFVKQKGYLLVHRYLERPTRSRSWPAYGRLLGRARRAELHVVCVLGLDALGRSRAMALRAALELHALGARVDSMQEPWFDPSDPLVGWVVGGEQHRSERSMAAVRAKRDRGERIGEIPYGWRLGPDGVRLEPDEDERFVVTHAKRLLNEGYSQRSIAHTFTTWGWASRAGTPFTHRQVGRMLRGAGLGPAVPSTVPSPPTT